MVNEEKVYLMTQIALDETKRCKKELSREGYYKSHYIRSHVMGVICNVTVSYFLLAFLVILYHADFIFLNIVVLDYARHGLVFFGIYMVLLVVSVFFSYFHFQKRYRQVRSKLAGYHEHLKKLEEYYIKSKEETEDDTIIGA
ncbi:MAG: hypothetical protein LUH14_12445 [Clostridiaceae bacterium]|nr:hypothetical protein [Clostridiaceae bacterium]